MEEGLAHFHKQVIETAPVVVGLLDRPRRCYRFLSPHVSKVLGYTADELRDAGSGVFGSIIDPLRKANWEAHFESLDEGSDDLISEILLQARHKNGELCWLLCRDRAYRRGTDGRVTEILSMAMDATLLMESRRKLIQNRDRTEAASRAKDEFMTLISHELHTPLNAVFGGAQLLQQEEMTEAQADCCEIILEGAQTLKKLFSDLLEYSQAQAESTDAVHEEIHLADELEMIRTRGLEMATARNLGWDLRIEGKLPPVVWGDRTRFLAVVRQLLENAMKFTVEGKVSLSVSAKRLPARAVALEMAVEDTGVGIAHEVRERIFDPFQQGEETGTRRFSGTGIGLTIAQRHVAAMGGTIDAESRPGEGSCFRVSMPFRLG